MKFMRKGMKINVIPGDGVIHDALAPGYYRVEYDVLEGYFLTDAAPMTLPAKIYGDITGRAERIFTTYMDRSSSTGVLLVGEKGGGKTMLACQVCINAVQAGQPVLICDQASHMGDAKFTHFMQSLTFPHVVMADEFEKNFNDEAEQSNLLSLMDGVSDSKRLFILTSNSEHDISEFMLDRPGRIFYLFRYDGLSESVIKEYCEDKSVSEEVADNLILHARTGNVMNFDIMKAIVEEVLRYNIGFSEAISGMNVGVTNYAKFYELMIRIDDGKFVKADRDPVRHKLGDHDVYYVNKDNFETHPKQDLLAAIFEEFGDGEGDIKSILSPEKNIGFKKSESVIVFSGPNDRIQFGLRLMEIPFAPSKGVKFL